MAKNHLTEISKLFQNGRMRRMMPFTATAMESIKLNYIKTYAYCRMLLSALKDMELIEYFAVAESFRSADAIQGMPAPAMLHIAESMGIAATLTQVKFSQAFSMRLTDFLLAVGDGDGVPLSNYQVSNGRIYMTKDRFIPLIKLVAAARIKGGLPIDYQKIPKEVIVYAKGVSISKRYKYRAAFKGETWIDRLLQNPISDVRHRTVNIILAPYLVNTKGLSVDDAAKIINDYIERCKKVDPATNVTPSYVKYQCSYAKRRGLKPMSFENAKELLGGVVNIDLIKPKKPEHATQGSDAERKDDNQVTR